MISLNAIQIVKWPHVPCFIIVRHPAEVVIFEYKQTSSVATLVIMEGPIVGYLVGHLGKSTRSRSSVAWVIGPALRRGFG